MSKMQTTGSRRHDKFIANSVGNMLSVHRGEDLDSYLSAVESYSQQEPIKQEDKKKAFQRILKGYDGMVDGKMTSFCYGLPIFAFDQTFCWSSSQHNPYRRNKSYPSWSCLEWDNAVKEFRFRELAR
jgi:hypothetical protein